MGCNEYHYLDVRLMGTIFVPQTNAIPVSWLGVCLREEILFLDKRWFSLPGLRWCEA